MNYTLHQLIVFSKVVTLKSITKASVELHMTQPAVSIQLKNFQDQFEIPLTEVVGRQLYVTDFGNEIFQMAKRILDEVAAINDKTLAYKGHLVGKLSLAVVSTGKYVMPYFLAAFLKEHPGIDLVMNVTNKSMVLESLQRNEVDFALMSVVPKELQINSELLMENHLYLVGGGSEKKTKKQFNKEDLKLMPLIYREEGSGTRYVMENYLNKHQIPINKKMELATNEAVKQAVIAGLGNSIMPIIGIKNELQAGDLKILPTIGFPIKSQWSLVSLKAKKLSPVAEAYLTYLKLHKKEILHERFSWMEQYLKTK